MAGIASAVYNSIFRRNQVYLASIFVGAFAVDMAFDRTVDSFWDTVNKGRQWKDIKAKYMQSDDE